MTDFERVSFLGFCLLNKFSCFIRYIGAAARFRDAAVDVCLRGFAYYRSNAYCSQTRDARVGGLPSCFHCILFLFLSSACISSSSRSAVSAGLSSECTLLAILPLLVAGAECNSNVDLGNLVFHATPSTPNPGPGTPSGPCGEACAALTVCRRGPLI